MKAQEKIRTLIPGLLQIRFLKTKMENFWSSHFMFRVLSSPLQTMSDPHWTMPTRINHHGITKSFMNYQTTLFQN